MDGVVFMARGQAVAPASAPAASAQPRPDVVGDDGDGNDSPSDDGGTPAAPPAVLPQPLQRQWRMRALDAQRLSEWSAGASVRATAVTPHTEEGSSPAWRSSKPASASKPNALGRK